ncbi:DUF2844 domain-containing protein [Paraburkholderia sp. SOS3]|jgi:hypothetical protein|uniref:DUF2844 domain-containing protein n=1 Tax=Paraburkholderia sp. SOS3 TaxID=1926494 RepID=UPI0009F8D410|nr:DUF2844 domain-containing protein [Paraburkholderia sp. SOS3]
MEAQQKALKTGFVEMAVAVCIGFTANTATAALGDFPLTGADPRVASSVMGAARVAKAAMSLQGDAATSSANALYSVNVVTLNSGTVVREFVATSSQKVFALIWNGPRTPDYADILGAYSERYLRPSSADVIHVGGLSQRSLSSQDLVVQSMGHPGRFSGSAYLPREIPAGVSLSELQ